MTVQIRRAGGVRTRGRRRRPGDLAEPRSRPPGEPPGPDAARGLPRRRRRPIAWCRRRPSTGSCQWFGGRALPMSGIFGVATLPEFRGAGVMRSVVTTVMREAHARGTPITALYPAVLGPVPRDRIRDRGHLPPASPAGRRDPGGCRRRLARPRVPARGPPRRARRAGAARSGTRTAPLEPTGDGWWVHRTFNPGIRPDAPRRGGARPGRRHRRLRILHAIVDARPPRHRVRPRLRAHGGRDGARAPGAARLLPRVPRDRRVGQLGGRTARPGRRC